MAAILGALGCGVRTIFVRVVSYVSFQGVGWPGTAELEVLNTSLILVLSKRFSHQHKNIVCHLATHRIDLTIQHANGTKFGKEAIFVAAYGHSAEARLHFD